MHLLLSIALAALVAFASTVAAAATLNLFGGSATWKSDGWSILNDRPNGGHSEGKLSLSPDSTALIFSGSLDLAPNHKGFVALSTSRANASLTNASPPFWDFTAWDGIEINVRKGDGKKYSLNLRTPTGKTTDGHPIDYKFIFETKASHPSTHVATWNSFSPMLRGVKIKAPKLDLGKVETILLMYSSLLGTQGGAFEVVLGEVLAVKGIAKEEGEEGGHDEL
ncbi:hypothetical protein HDU67_000211 [Dinochytrium kinnereticum]|nr:hypothetical protein HDU67_000211 [Dinochytrium kinnereticum]